MADVEISHPLPAIPAGAPRSPATPDGHSGADGVAVDNVHGTETPPSKRGRLLRGLQRISSSPSLARITRPRSATASSPYSVSGALSCVSLASTSSPFGQPSATGSYFSQASTGDFSTPQTSTPPSPAPESPGYDGIGSILAVRKVEVVPTPTTVSLPAEVKRKTKIFNIWASFPREIRLLVLAFLSPKELVRASRVSKEFHELCFDGQLWTSFDASEFYQKIPANSLANIIVSAGPFIRDLNLRGCVQIDHYKRTEAVVKACRNLVNATLEGCRHFQRSTLHSLIKANTQLVRLNLTGLEAVNNATCKIISRYCPQLEMLNVSWCNFVDARGIKMVVEGCPKLKDLRAGEVLGFGELNVAQAIFETNNLERLVLSGCVALNDVALQTMIQGTKPDIDILTGRPVVPPRKLRHLDLSRCTQLTSNGVKVLGHQVPDLESLQLSGVTRLTDAALMSILASTPRLTHLELEDVNNLTNSLLSEHLAKAPCASTLQHLNISYCENLGDPGLLPVLRKCTALKSVYMDNTRASDLALAEAADMVWDRRSRQRQHGNASLAPTPVVGLSLVVYDCQNVTWAGIRQVLSRNVEAIANPTATRRARRDDEDDGRRALSPAEVELITIKCYYGWQMTVDEHTKRVLRGDAAAATRLERKWAEYMQANEEAGLEGVNGRRRRRRARNAGLVHEEETDTGGTGRRRARTMGCLVM